MNNPIVKVYEYSLIITNSNEDRQSLIATFSKPLSLQSLKTWLAGWISCGYKLDSVPVLIRVI